ncbi:hypothetical protein WJX72_000344 [[Myrmecia] bisecta]|uniref:Dehydroascorbate reductase n=1 Tax=[Myrmecia] bisecta TaxID=41462 RepID=A0AAW1PCH4_9CHLO
MGVTGKAVRRCPKLVPHFDWSTNSLAPAKESSEICLYQQRSRAAGPHTFRVKLVRAQTARRFSHTAMAQAAAYDVYVKGSPEKNELGDCPFSHRVMLTLEEKQVPYHKNLLDEKKMPDWIEEKFGKKQIPFIQIKETGEWMLDSDKIVPFLEEKHPQPKLGTPDTCPQLAQDLFPTAFMEFLKSSGSEQKEKEAALVAQLKEINDFLEKNGPYIGGQNVCAADMQKAPQLYHIKVGTKAIKDWEWPAEFTALSAYLQRMMERPSWKHTYYTEKYVADGWKLKLKEQSEQ